MAIIMNQAKRTDTVANVSLILHYRGQADITGIGCSYCVQEREKR